MMGAGGVGETGGQAHNQRAGGTQATMSDIQQIETDDDEPINKHTVRAVVGALEAHAGIDARLMEALRVTPEEASDPETDPKHSGGVNLDMCDRCDRLMRTGDLLPFTLEPDLEEYYGGKDSTGSHNVTTLAERWDYTIGETVRVLAATGQIDAAIEAIRPFARNHRPETILAYCLARYASGWLAERILIRHGDFANVNVLQDEMGMDLQRSDGTDPEYFQLKPMTDVPNPAKLEQFQQKETPHLFYAWTGDGGIMWVDPDDHDDIKALRDAAARRAGIHRATLYIRTHGQRYTHDGRAYRWLWVDG